MGRGSENDRRDNQKHAHQIWYDGQADIRQIQRPDKHRKQIFCQPRHITVSDRASNRRGNGLHNGGLVRRGSGRQNRGIRGTPAAAGSIQCRHGGRAGQTACRKGYAHTAAWQMAALVGDIQCSITGILVGLFLYDALNPTVGWFQRQLASIHGDLAAWRL